MLGRLRTFDGFEEIDGVPMRYARGLLTDEEPDFETVPADCRVTGYNVRALADAFCDEVPPPAQPQAGASAPVAPVVTEQTQEQRQASRWQLCIAAGLTMPADTYSHLPRGIGKVARELRITRQALQQDLNAYRERLFGR